MDIEPTLTPEQWARVHAMQPAEALFRVVNGHADADVAFRITDEYRREVVALALANACLDDDDPHKLTWADVALIQGVRRDRTHPDETDGCDDCDGAYQRATERLTTLAAKLAALLPPTARGA